MDDNTQAKSDFLICPECRRGFKDQVNARRFWNRVENEAKAAMTGEDYSEKALNKEPFVCDICRVVLYLGGACEWVGMAKIVRLGWVTDLYMDGDVIKARKKKYENVAF